MNTKVLQSFVGRRTGTLLAAVTALLLAGCASHHHHRDHGVWGYPAVLYPYHPVHRWPVMPIHQQQIYAPQQQIIQNINTSLVAPQATYRDVTWRQSRSVFVDDPSRIWWSREDGTIREVDLVQHHRARVRDCRTVVQSVVALHHQSFQMASCDQ